MQQQEKFPCLSQPEHREATSAGQNERPHDPKRMITKFGNQFVTEYTGVHSTLIIYIPDTTVILVLR